ncbi:MAG: ATP-binding protein [Candidatus Aminicenantes bacterium]|nr:ATP-binding protein [Candidatus Aminicenantes bacterium]
MKVKEKRSLEVTVDKRHIIALGERLYQESVELLRELVNNAYDADATEVLVYIGTDRITVQDDGSGMDAEGLKQYFNVGSDEKVSRSVSPKFGRERVGQFGIGKFASLAAATRFEVQTQRGDFAARVVFDKEEWEKAKTTWQLPCEIFTPDPARADGTAVTLSGLTKTFALEDAEEKIKDGCPLKAPRFAVYLNGRRLEPRSYTGQRIPVLEGCPAGLVTGEIIIVPKTAASTKDLGIEVKVKGATIKRELFGMETWGKAVARVRGEIHANFLPVTSDRSNFAVDSEEYQQFLAVMEKIVGIIKRKLGKEADRREDFRAGRAVKDALRRIHRALALNPDFSPFGPIPLGELGGVGGAAAEEGRKSEGGGEVKAGNPGSTPPKKKTLKKRKNPLVKKITPNAIVRRIKFNEQAVSVCLDFFGESGPECFTEGNVVYVNRDHPLFKRESRKPATYTMYMGRLLTQEIALMKETTSPRLAFTRQSKLLKDAFADSEQGET